MEEVDTCLQHLMTPAWRIAGVARSMGWHGARRDPSLADMNVGERLKESEYVQQPENNRNHDNCIED